MADIFDFEDSPVDVYAGGLGDADMGNAIPPSYQSAIGQLEARQRPLLDRKNKLMEQIYEPDHLSFGGAVAQALVGFLPAILGKTLAGNAGGAIGAKAGLEGLGTYDTIHKAYRADEQKQQAAEVKTIEGKVSDYEALKKTLLSGGMVRGNQEEQRKYEDTRRRPGGDIYDFEMQKEKIQNQNRLGQIAAARGPEIPVSPTEIDAAITQLRRSVPPERVGELSSLESAIKDSAKNRDLFDTYLKKYVPSAGAANQAGYLALANQKFDSSRNSGTLRAKGANTDPRALPKAQNVQIARQELNYYGSQLLDNLKKNGVAYFDQPSGDQMRLAESMVNALRRMEVQGANFTQTERGSNLKRMLTLPDSEMAGYLMQTLRGISQEGKLESFLQDLNRVADLTLDVYGYEIVDGNQGTTQRPSPKLSPEEDALANARALEIVRQRAKSAQGVR